MSPTNSGALRSKPSPVSEAVRSHRAVPSGSGSAGGHTTASYPGNSKNRKKHCNALATALSREYTHVQFFLLRNPPLQGCNGHTCLVHFGRCCGFRHERPARADDFEQCECGGAFRDGSRCRWEGGEGLDAGRFRAAGRRRAAGDHLLFAGIGPPAHHRAFS
jgi:hypothetical protein